MKRILIFANQVITIIIVLASMLQTSIAQQVKIIWDNPEVHLAFPSPLKVRVLSASSYEAIAGEGVNLYSMIFDEQRTNNLREPNQGRYLFQRYVHPFCSEPPDKSCQEGQINLSSSDPEATVNFTKDHRQSDLNDFALGYGLYLFCIDIPAISCDPNSDPHEWMRVILPIDFRDSRYAETYGSASDIEIHFQISPYPNDTNPNECGIEFPFKPREGVDPYLRITEPRLIDLTPQKLLVEIQSVESIFEAGNAEFDFTIVNQLVDPISIPIDRRPADGMGLILPHSSLIKPEKFLLDFSFRKHFVITNNFTVHGWLSVESTSKEWDATITLEGQTEFYSAIDNHSFMALGTDNTKRIRFVKSSQAPVHVLAGFLLTGQILTKFDECVFDLGLPIQYLSSLPQASNPTERLTISRSLFTSANPDLPLTSVYAENVTVKIQGCHFSSGTTGICLFGDCRNSIIGSLADDDNKNTIENMSGHGIELVNLKSGEGMTRFPASDVCKVGYNIIRNNLFYGIHIRQGETNPHIFGNAIESNGHVFGIGNENESTQSMLADAVNVNSAYGVFQKNSMRSSGAYGLHAAAAGEPSGYDRNYPFEFRGENCISNNYFNIGANFNSKLHLGNPKAGDPNYSGGYNSVVNPRGTWSSTPWQVTLNNGSFGNLEWNYWKPIQLIQAVNTAGYSATELQPESEAVCPNGLTSGGGSSTTLTHQFIVDSIEVALATSNWTNAKSYSLLLLNLQPDPEEATIASSALTTTYLYTNDGTILQSLHDFAMDRSDTSRLFAAATYAMKAHNIAQLYPVSLSIGDSIAKWFPYSEHWQMAYLQNAFTLWDYYRNKSAAEELLQSVWTHYQDAYTIGAFISILGEYPQGVFAKRAYPTSKKEIPDFQLVGCYPNPFNPSTTISYSLPVDGIVTLSVRDAFGRQVSVLQNGYQTSGTHKILFDGSHLPSGMYFCLLSFDQATLIKPLMLLK